MEPYGTISHYFKVNVIGGGQRWLLELTSEGD